MYIVFPVSPQLLTVNTPLLAQQFLAQLRSSSVLSAAAPAVMHTAVRDFQPSKSPGASIVLWNPICYRPVATAQTAVENLEMENKWEKIAQPWVDLTWSILQLFFVASNLWTERIPWPQVVTLVYGEQPRCGRGSNSRRISRRGHRRNVRNISRSGHSNCVWKFKKRRHVWDLMGFNGI